eukprot:5782869-Heterocapsa_arctica.AAC.1
MSMAKYHINRVAFGGHKYFISASKVLRQCFTSASKVPQQCFTSASKVLRSSGGCYLLSSR